MKIPYSYVNRLYLTEGRDWAKLIVEKPQHLLRIVLTT